MKTLKHMVQLINGFLIGVANIIPGVSGGTFALVLGIFDRLIDSLKSFNLRTLRVLLCLVTQRFGREARQGLKEEWRRTDAGFLMLLGIGAVAAIAFGSILLSFLLEEYPGETLAFFVGLIIPSLAVPYGMMEKRGPLQLFWILPGAALTVLVSLFDIGGDAAGRHFLVIFLGGVLAVSAMILPGLSGSFCLLILGLYQPTLQHIKALLHAPSMASVRFLAIMGAGIAVGFVTFTRVMSFLLRRFRSATLAFLIGLILGSFWVLWPVKDFEATKDAQLKKKIQIATAPNELPLDEEGDLDFGRCLRLGIPLVVGLIGAMGMNRLGAKNREL